MSFRKIFTGFISKDKKRCSRCKRILDLSDFGKDCTRKDGVSAVCTVCNSIKVRESRYKREYGITREQYQQMYENQKGKCFICSREYDVLCVDHNHKTGKVRSLLCKRCNYVLGTYEERIDLFQSFIDYINLHNRD